MVTRSEFNDLNALAQKRTRDAMILVLQLLDDDQERAAALIATAIEFLHGAAQHLAYDGTLNEDQAFNKVLGTMLGSIGADKVTTALHQMGRQK
jgi:hypothetical protein